jgi:signal transduction histidine kinase
MFLSRSTSWLRSRPRAADLLLALLVTGISLSFQLTEHGQGLHDPSAWGVLLTVGSTFPIAWRRVAPVQVLVVVTAFQMVSEGFNYVGAGWSGVLIAAYTVGSVRASSALRRVALVMLPSLVAFIMWGVARGDAPWQAIISAPVMLGAALVLGDNMRRRRERVAELGERAERAERERELLAHQRVQEERTRIARELHDVVAHSVSLMVIQAAAARRQLPIDTDRADAAMATVESTGREAMDEMRRILGVLRGDDGEPPLEPQPSLRALGDLLDAAPDLPVTVHADGDLAHLPPGMELSAYRVVQEALTNVRRHAGDVHRVEVSVCRNDGSLVVEVADDGRGASALGAPGGGGYGLLGMRERVAAYDGDLQAGPRAGGGWRVRAVFPVGAA